MSEIDKEIIRKWISENFPSMEGNDFLSEKLYRARVMKETFVSIPKGRFAKIRWLEEGALSSIKIIKLTEPEVRSWTKCITCGQKKCFVVGHNKEVNYTLSFKGIDDSGEIEIIYFSDNLDDVKKIKELNNCIVSGKLTTGKFGTSFQASSFIYLTDEDEVAFPVLEHFMDFNGGFTVGVDSDKFNDWIRFQSEGVKKLVEKLGLGSNGGKVIW